MQPNIELKVGSVSGTIDQKKWHCALWIKNGTMHYGQKSHYVKCKMSTDMEKHGLLFWEYFILQSMLHTKRFKLDQFFSNMLLINHEEKQTWGNAYISRFPKFHFRILILFFLLTYFMGKTFTFKSSQTYL